MASPAGRRETRLQGVLLIASLAFAAMVLTLTACGGAGLDSTKVEASLREYLTGLDPKACLDGAFCDQGVFPLGAGFPQVREHSCKKVHNAPVHPELWRWSCVITFAHGKSALPVAVAVNDNGKVSSAVLVTQAPPLPPATVYEGGP
jgi:hypothetical protein